LEYSHRFRKPNRTLLSVLARSFLGGEPTVEEACRRASDTLGRRWRWLRGLARRYVAAVEGRTRPRQREVATFLRDDDGFQNAWAEHSDEIRIKRWLSEPQRMQPVAAAETWAVPVIESAGALAAWLELTPDELDWFADLKGLCYRIPSRQLRHYHYRVLTKPSGSVRLIEIPKPRLKQLQRRILSGILEKIPAHPAVHGFLKGRSIKTFAAPHVGQRVILRIDLKDFFPGFAGARIQTFFRTLGYPESVADLLGGICTNAVPRLIWREYG
jgi:RNA-directed DNA polymerase